MPIEPNQVVTINYVLTDEEGNILDTTSGRDSFSFLSGHDQILPKLEEAIKGMLIHSKKTVVLAPADGYGEYIQEAVQVANRADFPNDVQLDEGMSFMATMPDGNQQQFVIKKIEGDDVTIDFNHPLAGKTLTFEVELVDVRDATPEELSHGHAHGPEGHAH
jgi:FKBP-type peptidyl-prolyl cis-trans isomerase SlyD